MKHYFILVLSILSTMFVADSLWAQQGSIKGKVLVAESKPAKGVLVVLLPLERKTHTDDNGLFHFKKVPYGAYTVKVECIGARVFSQSLTLNSHHHDLNITLEEDTTSLAEIEVVSGDKNGFAVTNLKAVDGFGIYEAKKSEVVVMKEVTANLSTNNPRQVFSRITGLNIWESDGGGLQMGVGGRGLSPNRTSNFNTRQNGYDISADALGYPESYYTPPLEALKRIEIVRGAASLQYGTQFGGMLNFEMNKGPADKKIELVSRQTAGSWNYRGSFNSIGGTIAKKKLNYYAFYQRKQGNGWRPNSGYEANTAFAALSYNVNKRLSLNFDYTYMDYLAQQPGGLNDVRFNQDPSQSIRNRNWFAIRWNLAALTAEYKFNENTKLNIRNFGLLSSRQSVGLLGRINSIDIGGRRDLIDGQFKNIGNETRLIHHYKLGKTDETLLVGFRVYHGNTRNRQGEGSSGSDANFKFADPNNVEGSDFSFPNWNTAVFAEQIFHLSPKLSITPGVRFEYIKTVAEGYYRYWLRDLAGNVILDERIDERRQNSRSFLLGGVGLSYKALKQVEVYANFSQNYRAINFSDIRVNNLSFKVDENMKDEKGYTTDLGIRGNVAGVFRYELTGFYIRYNDRIGEIIQNSGAPTFQEYRYRTNVGDARNIGVEAFAEFDLWKLYRKDIKDKSFTLFGNMGFVDARYTQNNKNKSIRGNQVEHAPPLIFRAGSSFRFKDFRLSYQYSYTAKHYSDASNAERGSTAVIGAIPEYTVMDISASYTFKMFTLEASCNNLTNAIYFTRRAESYPGPGIIPADARSYFVTLQLKL